VLTLSSLVLIYQALTMNTYRISHALVLDTCPPIQQLTDATYPGSQAVTVLQGKDS